MKETPKGNLNNEDNDNKDSNSTSSPKKSNSPKNIKGRVIYDADRKDTKTETKVRHAPKFNEDEIKMLSNTHIFEKPHEAIDSRINQQTRKSMNNLHINSEIPSSKPSEIKHKKDEMKPLAKTQQTSNGKQIINNSSSQSSLGNFTGIMDLSSKKKSIHATSSIPNDGERKHETLKVEGQQTSKPLLSKTAAKVVRRWDTNESFDDEGSINPTLTANTIVNHQEQSSSSSEEEKLIIHKSNAIKVEKQESSSEGQEEIEQEDDENESDDEEFPVALNGLVFSFLPQEIAERLNHEQDWKKRVSAIQEMENLIKKQFSRPNEDFPIYVTDICKKMWKMMHDSNFKISLTALRIIHNLWMKYPKEILGVLSDLVTHLTDKLSDNKIVIRHAVLKVFYALTTSLGAKKIVNLVFQFIDHENWHIREEILSILIMACISSNSTWGLSDPKMISQVCSLTNDDKEKVSTAAFEALCIILSKDSSTAIILDSYLNPKIYNAISERCLSGILASVNYDGIVEFPTPQAQNSNHLIYTSSLNRDPEVQSVNLFTDNKKHLQSADHTVYSQNFKVKNKILDDRPIANTYVQSPYDKNTTATQSIGNKMWMPGFNMTASSIKSEQSVRVSKEPIMQTPVQFTNKMSNERRSDQPLQNKVEKSLNYTPEVHPHKPRTFGNSVNPSMTTHSMNVASTNMNSMHNTATKGPISQNEYYDDSRSIHNGSEYTMAHMRKSRPNDYQSEKVIIADNPIPSRGPIKPIGVAISAQSSMQSEAMHTGFSGFEEDSISESRQNRYSQNSNKSNESRNRGKNSMSQK
jgi:hypothetical protein